MITEKRSAERKSRRRRMLGWFFRHMKPILPLYIFSFVAMLVAVSLNAAAPGFTGRIIDEVLLDTGAGLDERAKLLARLLVSILVCRVGHNIINYFKEYTSDIAGSRLGVSMRSELFDHIQTLSVGFFRKNNTGELMARLKDDIDKIWFVLGFAGMLTLECIVHTVMILVLMIRVSPVLTLLPVAIMTVVAVTATKMEKALDKDFDAISEQNAELTTVVQESLAGTRTVKAFSREEFEIEKFRSHNEKYYKLNMDMAKTQIKYQPMINLASRVLVVSIAIVGGCMVLTGFTGLTLGNVGTFMEYGNSIIWPIECLAWLATELASAVASSRKVARILDAEPDITDPESPTVLENVRGDVAFDSVSFSIEEKQILNNVSFLLPAGKTLGIMGLTGSGKSSVINLLERFYDASSGSVRLDGVDVRELSLSQLRGSTAAVMQDVFLFSDSISENISMGSRGKLTETDLREAAEAACALDFIDELEDGFETIIGERGVGLSGGQKQRISIARAVAKKAPVLVLDDATSALDMETEYRLQQSLSRIDCTKIIIAHRISAVKDADEIIVLDNGSVIERGTHAQLMALRGQYFKTYIAQYNTEEDLVPAAGKEA